MLVVGSVPTMVVAARLPSAKILIPPLLLVMSAPSINTPCLAVILMSLPAVREAALCSKPVDAFCEVARMLFNSASFLGLNRTQSTVSL